MRAVHFVAVMFGLIATLELALPLPVFARGHRGYNGEMNNKDIPEINKGLNLFEGDIQLPPGFDRNIIKDPIKLWPLPVPVEFDPLLGQSAVSVISKSLEELRLKSCVDFKLRDTEPYYIKFTRNIGCSSMVGFRSIAEQPISIALDCENVHTVTHEILHALGFGHEQTRYDRDDHVIILWHHIDRANLHFFQKMTPEETTLGLGYDYKSIMHYRKDFSTNGKGDTMLPRVPEFRDVIGNLPGMSPNDVWELNSLYSCNSTVTFLDGCSFEGDMNCEFTACTTSKNRWRRVTAIRGGPTEDHSIPKSKKGHFLHFSTVSGVTGDRALLQTKIMMQYRNFKCLEFFYYHNGHPTDQLNIWIKEFRWYGDFGVERQIGQITGPSADYWQPKYIHFNTLNPFQIQFEAVKGQGMSSGGLSLDDINLSETVCPEHVWRMTDLLEKVQSDESHFIHGPRLYSGEGYSYQVSFAVTKNEIQGYFRMVSGLYDYYLQWPCPGKHVQFQLVEQTPSIQQRMSKIFSLTATEMHFIYVTSEDGTVNVTSKWDNPAVIGEIEADSEGLFYAGPMIGPISSMTKIALSQGDYFRGGAAFVLINFEDIQMDPIHPQPRLARTPSVIPSPNLPDNSTCVFYELSPNRSAACMSSLFLPSIAAITAILSMR